MITNDIYTEQWEAQAAVCEAIYASYKKHQLLSEYCSDSNSIAEIFSEGYFSEASNENGIPGLNGLSIYKFNNHYIIQAINHFNKARQLSTEEKDNTNLGTLKYYKITLNKEFKKGIECLENQFNCRLNISRLGGFLTGGTNTIASKNFIRKLFKTHKITVSKTKGFQLDGLPIVINLGNEAIIAPSDPKLFGQWLTGILLHEIFHNIVYMLSINVTKVMDLSDITTAVMSKVDDKKAKETIAKNAVQALSHECGDGLSSSDKNAIVENITDNQYSEPDNNSDELRRNRTKTEKAIVKQMNQIADNALQQTITNDIKNVTGFIGGIIAIIKRPKVDDILMALGVGIQLFQYYSRVFRKHDFEEFYCDLFASMYQLPPTFKHIFKPSFFKRVKSFSPNALSADTLKNLKSAESRFVKNSRDEHPGMMTRGFSAVKAARQMLEHDDIAPETRKYCEWIIANFSKLEDLKFDDKSEKKLFNAENSEDLDKHLNALVDTNKINVTESWSI